MFHVYLTLAYLYVLWRFIVPLPVSTGCRTVLAITLLVISKYHLILILVYGTMFSPEFPRAGVLVAGWLFCAFVLILVFTLLSDGGAGLLALYRRRRLSALARGRVRSAIAVVALGLSALGVYQAVQVPEVRRLELTIKGLPSALDGMRIVQLTDLHISRLFQEDWVRQVVARSNALEPDLVLITGDLIDGTVEARRQDVAPLSALKASRGVIAVPGNHEYYFDGPRWMAVFRQLGMQVLVNGHTVLGEGQKALVVAGVTDEAAPAFGLEGPNLSQALQGVPAEAPIILLKHRPVGADQAAAAGVSLQLSGHTHGGMVKGLDLIARQANQGFVSGRYNIAGMTLYLSNGTGLWNGFPIRLGVPAEITEIVLRSHSPDEHSARGVSP
ncbi:metallophosphoesterase [Pseudomonas sp. NPDC089734]|uniref:metallophosphoesterase n=1 Tax=Pseudomonas sp. NPDC089734 TaxID=3364469 RepID=UPI00382F92F2